MAKYVNVSRPVVIEATQQKVASIDNYTRRVCFVSNGDTSLNVGAYKEVNNSTFADVVTTNGELYNKLVNFFSHAGGKAAYIFESGAEATALQTKVDTLHSFISNGACKCFLYVLPNSWYEVKIESVTATANMGSTVIKAAQSGTPEAVPLTTKNFSLKYRPIGVTYSKDGIITFDPYALTITRHETAQDSDFPITVTLTDTNNTDAQIGEIVVNGNTGTTASAVTYSQAANVANVAVPNLVALHSADDSSTRFIIGVGSQVNPTTDANFAYYNGLSGLQIIAENLNVSTNYVSGSYAGLFASSKMDFSSSNMARSLNYQKLNYTPIDYSATMKETLLDAPITFAATLANTNVILGSRQLDGTPFEVFYQLELLKYDIENMLTQLIINGQNNANSQLRFNQNGFDTVRANIASRLNRLAGFGVIDEFGMGYDVSTNAILGTGDVTIPTYASYLQTNYSDYQKEILTGVYFYVRIGRFIKQIGFNVNFS